MPRPYLPIAAGFICLPVVLYSVAAPQGEQRDFSSEPTSTAKSDVPASQPAPPTSSAYADLFSRLREALVHPRPTRHPRVPDEVMTLICAREDATGAICAEADRAGLDPANEPYLAQLYFILGFVKDVQSVPWVAGKLKTPQQRYVVRDWLDGWLAVAPLAYYMEHPAEWEQVSGTWAEFFRQLMASDVTPAQRARFVLAMSLWFSDAATSESVSRLVSSSDAKPVEKLLGAFYLQERGRPVDDALIKDVVDSVTDAYLIGGVAGEMRDERFVPYLIQLLDRDLGEWPRTSVCYALKRITLAQPVDDCAGWREWYERHGSEGRRVWLEGFASRVDALLSQDRVSDAANLVWIMPWDPGLLPHYQRWTASRELCGAIAANVRPTIDPRCRAQVSALAHAICASGVDVLPNGGRLVRPFACDAEGQWCDCFRATTEVRRGKLDSFYREVSAELRYDKGNSTGTPDLRP
jgi:hypothetical protein